MLILLSPSQNAGPFCPGSQPIQRRAHPGGKLGRRGVHCRRVENVVPRGIGPAHEAQPHVGRAGPPLAPSIGSLAPNSPRDGPSRETPSNPWIWLLLLKRSSVVRRGGCAFCMPCMGCCVHWTNTPRCGSKWPNLGPRRQTKPTCTNIGKHGCLELVGRHLDETGQPWILNLASAEYSQTALHGIPSDKVVTCQFLEDKGGQFRSVSAFAKAARGAMARHVLEHDLQSPEQLTGFGELGYVHNPEKSAPGLLVFTRPSRP